MDGKTTMYQHPRGHGICGHLDNEHKRYMPQRARSKSFTWEQPQKEWQRGRSAHYPNEVIKDNHAVRGRAS
eukprot:12040185-Prorocentrum_lima.AAC.1